MKEGIIKDTYELIAKEIQLILSLSYLFMIAVGMLFNYEKYWEFGINIFQYADIFDFLIAPFEDFRILAFALVSTLLTIMIIAFDTWWKKTYPKSYSWVNFKSDKKSWFNSFRIINFVLIFVLYIGIMADTYGKKIKKEINQQAEVKITFADSKVMSGIVIGKTKEMLFLLQEEKVKIIPLTSQVREMELLPKAK